MKLHLTATSERGKEITKSGNEFIKIEVVDENREHIATIRFDCKKDDIGELITYQVWPHERIYKLD